MAIPTSTVRTTDPAANPDPITHAPGAHPVGTGIGAAVGGAAGIGGAIAAGAAIGSVAGPVGTAAGAAIGAVAGGLVGKAVAEKADPTILHSYWRKAYVSRPYVTAGAPYEQYAPAYQYGWESKARHGKKTFEEADADMSSAWQTRRGASSLSWEQARPAARDAWNRVDEMGMDD